MSKLKSLEELFAGRHFECEAIILCVRWYLPYKPSLGDLVEMIAERGLSLAHTTILRWVRRYSPELVKRWNWFGTATGQSWRVDETLIKLLSVPRGGWARPDGGLSAARQARRASSQSLSSGRRSNIKAPRRKPSHLKVDGELPEGTKVRSSEVPEQFDRAGSPQH
jgi:hypothetical protein